MRTLSAYDVVRITEWGHDKHPIDRAMGLLRVAAPERSPEQLARLTIGQRDELLLRLRRSTFGDALEVRVACPVCGCRMQFNRAIGGILLEVPPPLSEYTIEHDGLTIRYRLADSRDLAAITGVRDPAAARDRLVARCVLGVTGADAAETALPATAIEAMARAMGERDPQADLRFELTCPAERHRFVAALDILAIFWTELCAYVARLESDVHEIARVYGWTEEVILSMSSRRRARYAALAGRD